VRTRILHILPAALCIAACNAAPGGGMSESETEAGGDSGTAAVAPDFASDTDNSNRKGNPAASTGEPTARARSSSAAGDGAPPR
jgi:hypothetical protein